MSLASGGVTGRSRTTRTQTTRTGARRRAFLTAGLAAVALPLAAAATTRPAAAAPPAPPVSPPTAPPAVLARPPAVFYSPHADDETLSMGVAVVDHLVRGRDVVLVLVTQGCSPYMLDLLNGDAYDPVSSGVHSPVAEGYLGPLVDGRLTAATVGAARLREWAAASAVYGTAGTGLLSTLSVGLDEGVTVDAVRSVVAQVSARYPGASHATMSWTDPHPDHAACGHALRTLRDEDAVGDVRWYVQHGHEADAAAQGVRTWSVAASPSCADAVRRAGECYRVWDPAAGEYGFGYRSVQLAFDALAAAPSCTVHL